MKLSELIIDYRKRMNISQREFSRRCDLSNSYISFLEKNLNPKTGKPLVPTLEQYKKLADGMGMSVHQLFEQLDEDSPVDLHVTVVEEPAPANDDEIRILIPGASKLKPEQIERAKNAFRAMFMATYPELFEEGEKDK